VGPLSLLDDHSRYLIALRGTWTTKAEAVREQLESAFMECGVPEAMLMDHGTPWWNARAPTGATWLTVWLMQQASNCTGADTGIRKPRARWNAFTVRCSARNYARRARPATQQWLDEYRHEYNRCGRMKRWKCRLRRAGGDGARAPITRTLHLAIQEGATVVKVSTSGQIWTERRRWNISYALADSG